MKVNFLQAATFSSDYFWWACIVVVKKNVGMHAFFLKLYSCLGRDSVIRNIMMESGVIHESSKNYK